MQKYHWILRILHWILAIIIFGALASGIYMSYYAVAPDKYTIYAIHKAVGTTILALIILRYIIRSRIGVPDMPRQLSSWKSTMAKVGHYLLYLLVLITALSGYIMTSAGGYKFSWFSFFNVPLLIPENKYLADLAHNFHNILPYILLAAIAFHILATLKHVLIDKVNILKRII